ncbi:hypothetical protein E2C01_036705 [Portunus trituberculatus]|uniref:Uncharacterized protein n=1 Tax=Portunus trituberculatus TaxID=210409 RepID=A0A5B7FBX8_PORTR|nr:hypothetical protein [Portunus trituberculatus]
MHSRDSLRRRRAGPDRREARRVSSSSSDRSVRSPSRLGGSSRGGRSSPRASPRTWSSNSFFSSFSTFTFTCGTDRHKSHLTHPPTHLALRRRRWWRRWLTGEERKGNLERFNEDLSTHEAWRGNYKCFPWPLLSTSQHPSRTQHCDAATTPHHTTPPHATWRHYMAHKTNNNSSLNGLILARGSRQHVRAAPQQQ